MSAELDLLRRLRVFEEPNGSYGVDDTANVATDFVDVPFTDGSLKWKTDQELFDPKIGSVLLEYQDKKVLGRAFPSLSFEMPLHSHGIALDGVNAIPTKATWALLRILTAVFGASTAPTNGGARAVVAGSTTSTINVTAGRGTDFSPGQAVGVRVTGAAAGTIETREVLSVTANTITVTEQFSAAPVTGGTVYGAVSVYTIDDPLTSLQFVMEGLEADDKLAFFGMQGSPKFTIPTTGDIPKMSLDLKGCRWARLASGAVAPASFANLSLFGTVFNEVHWTTISGSTVARNVIDQSAQRYEPAIQYEAVRGSASANNNVIRMKRKQVRPPLKGGFTSLFQDSTWETERASATSKRLDMQLGNTPGTSGAGGAIMICQRQMQASDVQPATHESGIGGLQVSAEGRIPDSGTSAFTRAVSAMHFF